jgi:hypothetical protein
MGSREECSTHVAAIAHDARRGCSRVGVCQIAVLIENLPFILCSSIRFDRGTDSGCAVDGRLFRRGQKYAPLAIRAEYLDSMPIEILATRWDIRATTLARQGKWFDNPRLPQPDLPYGSPRGGLHPPKCRPFTWLAVQIIGEPWQCVQMCTTATHCRALVIASPERPWDSGRGSEGNQNPAEGPGSA